MKKAFAAAAALVLSAVSMALPPAPASAAPTTYTFSALTVGQHVAFDPATDVLDFDSAAISAASVRLVDVLGNLGVTAAGKTIYLDGTSLAELAVSPLFARHDPAGGRRRSPTTGGRSLTSGADRKRLLGARDSSSSGRVRPVGGQRPLTLAHISDRAPPGSPRLPPPIGAARTPFGRLATAAPHDGGDVFVRAWTGLGHLEPPAQRPSGETPLPPTAITGPAGSAVGGHRPATPSPTAPATTTSAVSTTTRDPEPHCRPSRIERAMWAAPCCLAASGSPTQTLSSPRTCGDPRRVDTCHVVVVTLPTASTSCSARPRTSPPPSSGGNGRHHLWHRAWPHQHPPGTRDGPDPGMRTTYDARDLAVRREGARRRRPNGQTDVPVPQHALHRLRGATRTGRSRSSAHRSSSIGRIDGVPFAGPPTCCRTSFGDNWASCPRPTVEQRVARSCRISAGALAFESRRPHRSHRQPTT